MDKGKNLLQGIAIPTDEYEYCPYCKKKLSKKIMKERFKRKAVKCEKCQALIMPDLRVFNNKITTTL